MYRYLLVISFFYINLLSCTPYSENYTLFQKDDGSEIRIENEYQKTIMIMRFYPDASLNSIIITDDERAFNLVLNLEKEAIHSYIIQDGKSGYFNISNFDTLSDITIIREERFGTIQNYEQVYKNGKTEITTPIKTMIVPFDPP